MTPFLFSPPHPYTHILYYRYKIISVAALHAGPALLSASEQHRPFVRGGLVMGWAGFIFDTPHHRPRRSADFVCRPTVISPLPRPARLHEALLRLRRLGDKGTLQLAIDVDSVRRALLDFPRVATSGRHAAEHAAAAAAAGRGAVLGGADRAQPMETVSGPPRAVHAP